MTSGGEARTVFQDAISGFDEYQIELMPREEGIYLIEKMQKYTDRSQVNRITGARWRRCPETGRAQSEEFGGAGIS